MSEKVLGRMKESYQDWRDLRDTLVSAAQRSGAYPQLWSVSLSIAGKDPEPVDLENIRTKMRERLISRWRAKLTNRRRQTPLGQLFLNQKNPSINAAIQCLRAEYNKALARDLATILAQERGLAWELLVLLVLLRKSGLRRSTRMVVGAGQTEGIPISVSSDHSLFLWYLPGEMKPPGLTKADPIRGVRPDFLLTRTPNGIASGGFTGADDVIALLECKAHGFRSAELYSLWGQARHFQASLAVLLPWASKPKGASYDLFRHEENGLQVVAQGSPAHLKSRQSRGHISWQAWFDSLMNHVQQAALTRL
jgi:hypothetical protein